MKDCIKKPEDIDWAYFWGEKLREKKDRKKDWNKNAPNFGKSAKKDDYHTKIINRIKINPDETLLDLGCGEGSITIPLAKKAKSVTGIDSAYKMLELLNEKTEKQGIKNIKTIEKDLEEVNLENTGAHDVVIASRSLNNVINIQDTIANINEIANKYVFITLFGPNNWKIEKEFYNYLGKPYHEFPSHRYFFNILVDMGIYPNVENLNIGHYREYETIDEAIESGKWRLDLLSDDEIQKLHKYLEKILKRNPETGKLSNESDRADWVLYWWKKD